LSTYVQYRTSYLRCSYSDKLILTKVDTTWETLEPSRRPIYGQTNSESCQHTRVIDYRIASVRSKSPMLLPVLARDPIGQRAARATVLSDSCLHRRHSTWFQKTISAALTQSRMPHHMAYGHCEHGRRPFANHPCLDVEPQNWSAVTGWNWEENFRGSHSSKVPLRQALEVARLQGSSSPVSTTSGPSAETPFGRELSPTFRLRGPLQVQVNLAGLFALIPRLSPKPWPIPKPASRWPDRLASPSKDVEVGLVGPA
jgi:hypothetical protein